MLSMTGCMSVKFAEIKSTQSSMRRGKDDNSRGNNMYDTWIDRMAWYIVGFAFIYITAHLIHAIVSGNF